MKTIHKQASVSNSPFEINPKDNSFFWIPKELLKMKNFSDVQISPDGRFALFVLEEMRNLDDKAVFASRIYKVEVGKDTPFPFTQSESSSSSPRWSPDGKWVSFISSRGGIKNLYLIRSDGGEAIALTKAERDVETYVWSPDSQKVAFVMSDKMRVHKESVKEGPYEYKKDHFVNRLWLLNIYQDSEPTSLTSDAYYVRGQGDFGNSEAEFDWSNDSQKIVFAYSPSSGLDSFYLDSALASVDTTSGSITPWEKHSRYEAFPRFSPDGKSIAYLSSDSSNKYALIHSISIRSQNGNFFRTLPATFNEGAYLIGPHLLGWHDDHHILFFEPKGTRFHLLLLPLDGSAIKEVKTNDLFITKPTLNKKGSLLGFVVESAATPPEVFISKVIPFEPLQLSHFNDSFLSFPTCSTKRIQWKASDDMHVEGLLTYPVHYEKGKKYPFLLIIHGGPMGFFTENFLGTPNPYPLTSFAEAGFVIFRPNPRGSCGYGKAFRSANYADWGGKDFDDIMTGVDMLIKEGIADPNKMGVMGWSYGGYMTAWTITQTSRFQAASIGAGLCNLISMSGTTDLHRFLSDYFLGDFSENGALYEKRSPIYHVNNVKTECLIQHGTEDKRVPVTQAYEFYHALERADKKASLVLYPKMGHRLTCPHMLLDAMERNLKWFQEKLMSYGSTLKTI